MSSRRHRDHSRRSSTQPQDINLAVTQGFEGLNLGETANAYSTGEYPSYSATYSLPVAEEPPFIPDLHNMSHYYEMATPHQGYSGAPTHGYTFPNTEVPLSRSMSGHSSHMLPSTILPSSFEDFADVERDVSRQRRRRQTRVRREQKTRTRRRAAMLSQGEGDDHGSSLAGELSGSIDNLTAHHPGVHGGPGYSYTSPDPNRSNYGTTSSTFDYAPMYSSAPSFSQTFSANSPDPYRSERPRQHHHESAHNTVQIEPQRKPQCWDHGCNGRTFSTFSNLLRHQREKSGTSTKSSCPRCGAEFTRKTARDGHMAHDKCKGGRK